MRTTVFALMVAAAAAVIIAVLIFPVLRMNGTSMTNTLMDGDVVVTMSTSDFSPGDIIAFYYNNTLLVKRVIAVTGDWVDIDKEGNVFVNGEELDEPYVTDKALGECNITLPYQVPEGRIFVMGDHRETSIDSRNTAVGCVNKDLVVGKLLFRVWPLSGLGAVQ
ncbi:signal peptidase I [bacterium D16-76]|nr:signal peptidase I [bacterium D16-76]